MDHILDKEKEMMMEYAAELSESRLSKKYTAAEMLARAAFHVSSERAAEFKKKHGGWICGTHANNMKRILAYQLEEAFTADTCKALFEYCKTYMERAAAGQTDADMERMLDTLLDMTPETPVNLTYARLLAKLREE